MDLTFSVIIPCYNEQKYLGKLLDQLSTQTKHPTEVIVCDCDSEDKTLEVAQSFAAKLNLITTQSTYRSAAAARNTGAARAKSNYLIFIDADITIPPDFIVKIENTLRAKPVDFLTPLYQSDGQSLLDRFGIWFTNLVIKLNSFILHRAFGIGGVMCVRKEIHSKIGGFAHEMMTRDDMNYINKLQKHSVSFLYLSDLFVIPSSRRFKNGNKKDTIYFVLHYLTRRFGHKKRYGHYNK